MQLTNRMSLTTFVSVASLAGVLCQTPAVAEPIMFAADTGTDLLNRIDAADASATPVGPFGVDGFMAGLGYDSRNDILYGTTTYTDNLYSIDCSTGNATLIGSLGVELIHALEYDDSTATLFGAWGTQDGDGLYEIDTSTGAATLIGHIGFFHPDHTNSVAGLAIHPDTGTLYGAIGGPAFDWGALIEIDIATAQGTLVAEYTQHIAGLAFHPETNVLYGIDNWDGALYTIDVNTGQTTLVGDTELGNALGLAITPEPTSFSLLALAAALGIGRRRR